MKLSKGNGMPFKVAIRHFLNHLLSCSFISTQKIVAISSNRQDGAIKSDLEILNWQLAYHCELLVKSTTNTLKPKVIFVIMILAFALGFHWHKQQNKHDSRKTVVHCHLFYSVRSIHYKFKHKAPNSPTYD